MTSLPFKILTQQGLQILIIQFELFFICLEIAIRNFCHVPAVEECQGRKARIMVKFCFPRIAFHTCSIQKSPRVEVQWRPSTNFGMHSKLLWKHCYGPISLQMFWVSDNFVTITLNSHASLKWLIIKKTNLILSFIFGAKDCCKCGCLTEPLNIYFKKLPHMILKNQTRSSIMMDLTDELDFLVCGFTRYKGLK